MYDSYPSTYSNKDENYVDFSKINVGLKKLPDAIFDINAFKTVNPSLGDKRRVLEALKRNDKRTLREISDFFYQASGIYSRWIQYLAQTYRCDWYVTPFILDSKKINENKILKAYSKVLNFLDNSGIKSLYNRISLEVVQHGVFYGILMKYENSFAIQKLPVDYCRVRYFQGNVPMVELNMRYFDLKFPDINYRQRILKLFPKDVQKGYILYRQNKLMGDYLGDTSGWYLLEPGTGVRFCLDDNEIPPLAKAIPAIIDLDNAQEMDRRKTMQQLLKILVQKLPLDKNGELLFSMEEAKDIHNNAVDMISRKATGLDVLTTFADVESIDTYDKNASTTKDDLQKIERTAYNNAGISQNLFNTGGNLALEKSINTDEAMVKDLIFQFQTFLTKVIEDFSSKNHYSFKVQILETTMSNYKDMAKLYKEQVSLGFSKFLPQIALGHSQSSILASLQFENNVLHLADIMIPPQSSNTMSSNTEKQKSAQAEKEAATNEKPQGGRPEKADSEKSEKTILNKESMN